MLSVLWQPRYVRLTALMLLVAAICMLLGVWQMARLSSKHDTNITLRRNAHAAPVAVTTLLHPAGAAPTLGRTAVQFRQATATGRYDAVHQSLLRNQTIDGDNGYLVVTPLHMSGATLLVVRGFVTGPSATITAPAPPTGPVSVTVRLWPPSTSPDEASHLARGQVESINAAEQAARLGTPVLDGYGILLPGQQGTAGIVAIPPPDLSNPAGGVPEIQHVAYVIQWFLFAGLALAAPIVMARADAGRPTGEIDDETPAPTPEQARQARLADRYGRARR
ncbi:MAG TPA: SURF1 family protein [Jatrophihabitantaceae bacterium]